MEYFKTTGRVIKADPNVDVVKKIREFKDKSKFDLLKVDWSDMLHTEKLKIDDKEPLRLEQESFLQAVAGQSTGPEVSAKEGLAAMECAEMILSSLQKHQF